MKKKDPFLDKKTLDKLKKSVEDEKTEKLEKNRIKKNKKTASKNNKTSDKKNDTVKNKKTEIKKDETSLKEAMGHVIKPEERTLGNYINPLFWINKGQDYFELKKKEQEDFNIFDVLYQGAQPTAEYYILTILSCIIATIGLIQNSTAIIIGAMIVAPLMTPILAFSLGVVWGELRLIKISSFAILKGVVWPIIISALITYLTPITTFSTEIMSRTVPSFFDIIVAIASGFVGAYGYANKKISNTIIGIAIAVALMPPLCTIGIGLGKGHMAVAYGATLLFIINLISISLAGAIVFWLLKIHPISAEKEEVKKRALSQILISVVILAVISIPIGFFMYEGYQFSQTKSKLIAITKKYPQYKVFSMKKHKTSKGLEMRLVMTGPKTPSNNMLIELQKIKKNLLTSYSSISDIRISFIRSLELNDTVTKVSDKAPIKK